MLYTRRVFTLLALVTAMTLSAAAASAQEIKYFVVQSTGLFEITSQSTGGRFVIQPRNEWIHVPGRGNLQVRGRTDRAARLEVVATQVRGAGRAHARVTFRPQNSNSTRTIYEGPLDLTAVVPQTVSADTNFDNVNVAITQNGRTISRRLPLGSRP
jgi:hypothetical protein